MQPDTPEPNKPRWQRILDLESQAREAAVPAGPGSSRGNSKTFLIFATLAVSLFWMLRHGGDLESAPSIASSQTAMSTTTDRVASPDDEQLPPQQSSRITDLHRNIVNGEHLEVITVSATGLFREYESNEVATDMRLKGKIVEIHGTITGINKDIWDNAYVTLRTPNDFMSASVRPIESEVDKVALLRKGQSVAFRCQQMRRIMGSPSGSNCVLM